MVKMTMKPKQTKTESQNMSTQTEATVEAPHVAVTVTVETPKVIVEAMKNAFSAENKAKKSYVEMARDLRKFGLESTAKQTPREQVRQAIAQALAAARKVPVEKVTNTVKNGGDATLYPLLSTFCNIAIPGDEDKARRLDDELAKEDTSWDEIKAATRKQRTGEPTDGAAGPAAAVKPFSEDDLAGKIVYAVTMAAGVQIPAQRVFDLAIATLREAIAQAYKGVEIVG